MLSITSKELNAIEDQLNYEQLIVKKYKYYANICQDAQIKTICEQIAAQHKAHFEKLLIYLK